MGSRHLAWTGLLSLLGLLRAGAMPAYDEAAARPLDHVTVITTPNTDAALATAVGNVCDLAAGVYEQELKLRAAGPIRVYLSPTTGWRPSVVTNRRTKIYVSYNLTAGWQVGRDNAVPQPRAVYLLCRAVAELYNPRRVPGVEQLLASRYAVPAALDQLGAKLWVTPYDVDTLDGAKLFESHAGDGLYLEQHPRWAAAVGLQKLIEQLKPEGFARTFAAVKGDGRPALAMLRKLAAAQARGLDAAFADYDTAVDLSTQADGSLLLTSFETAEQVRFLPVFRGCTLTGSAEWASDGKRCAKFAIPPRTRSTYALVADEDWRYQDWSGFSTLEFDAHNGSDQGVGVAVECSDHESSGHGSLTQSFPVAAGAQVHCVLSLLGPEAAASSSAVYYGGQVRLDEMACLAFGVETHQNQAPLTVHLDNLRLKP